ncbi:MAG: shikimate dehydrogenase, partial [Candidatus Hydrothermarchaeales archaeon]
KRSLIYLVLKMTRIFCVMGHPISHSMSPAMHNAAFESLGLDCYYTLFDVAPGDLGDAIKGIKALGFGGTNVTIPHKVSVIKHLDSLSEEARIIGAVNTVKISDELKGFNTDGFGALEALKKNGADPKGKKVLILGSGGAARAISVTLALKGGIEELTILGVDEDELSRLTEDIKKGTGASVEGLHLNKETTKNTIQEADILIHATPVGMHPNVDDTLVTAEDLKEDMALMDIIYNPLQTRLMKEAKKAGIKTVIGGVDMFVNQGAEALRIWLKIEPPVELMKRTVISALKGQ